MDIEYLGTELTLRLEKNCKKGDIVSLDQERVGIISWEPALWTLMSGGADADDDDVKKKHWHFQL